MGPTATGKSALAVEVAARLGDVEVLTVDSMQVYRGMDIGTATPPPAERGGVPHHLLDLADPGEDYDLTRWVAAAREVLAAVEGRGHRALLVGGTGLWFRALVDRLEPPGRWPEVAAALAAEPDTAALHRRLAACDPVAAGRIDPGNRRRVLRALEVVEGSGRPFSASGPGLTAYPATAWRVVGLWVPRRLGAERIAARVRSMAAAGLVAEVEALRARPGGLSRTARQALGYREVLAHLEGGVPLDVALAEATRRTVAFARRQRMWWRRDPRVAWIGVTGDPLAAAGPLLGDWALR